LEREKMNPLYKYIGIALLLFSVLGGVYAAGHHNGYAPEHDKLVAFQAKVTQEANDQNAAAIEKDKSNEAQTLAVANAYTLDNNRLSAALEQLRKSTNRFSQLPKAADSSKGANGAIGESGGAPICTQEFVSSALKDAMTLQKWQEWAERLNLPVE
jgi:hypothetical protein